MKNYCENSNQLAAVFPQNSIKVVQMSHKYAFQKIDIFKMKLRLGKSSQLLQRIAFVFFLFWNNAYPLAKSQKSVFW